MKDGKYPLYYQLFNSQNFLFLKKALDPNLIESIRKRIAFDSFHEISDFVQNGHEEQNLPMENFLNQKLNFIFNSEKWREFFQKSFQIKNPQAACRISRMLPNSKHQLPWHQDNSCGRLIGFCTPLSKESFDGGESSLMQNHSKKVFYNFSNNKIGDILFFRIGDDFWHRVSPVKGSNERIMLTGWITDLDQIENFGV